MTPEITDLGPIRLISNGASPAVTSRSLAAAIRSGKTVVRPMKGLPLSAREQRFIDLLSRRLQRDGEFGDLGGGQVDREWGFFDEQHKASAALIAGIEATGQFDPVTGLAPTLPAESISDRGKYAGCCGYRVGGTQQESMIDPVVGCDDSNLSVVADNPRRAISHLGDHCRSPAVGGDHDA